MKKLKRILAILAVILLLSLYSSTLVFALLGREYFQMLMASISTSIILPVFIWIYTIFYKLLKEKKQK